jgi:ectoine hydroxylase-related dioxygenase (phytanoyl-CoA dioxygenase family)
MNRRPLREITESDIQSYQEDGVVCLRGMLDRDWIERMSQAVDRAMQNPGRRAREATRPGNPGRFHSNVFMWRWDADFRALALESPAAEIAARLMGVKKTRFFYDQLFVKEPETREITHWHHDLPYWPVRGQKIASIWLPLTPVSRDTSGVEYIAGSHRWNKFYRAVTPDEDPYFTNHELEVCPDFSEQRGASNLRFLCWDLMPGDVVAHHPLTVHGAGGNQSRTQRRVAISIRFMGDDVVWDLRPATLPLPGEPKYPPGTPVADDRLFPIAWEAAAPAGSS